MARNGSGTYTKVNTFVSGASITATGHNQNWDDIVTEMTNSVAADGQTSMTGPLKLASGSVSAPAAVFASDTDTGIYRIGANNIGIAVGGSKVLDLSSTSNNTIGLVKQNGFALLPVGTVFPYAGSSAPSGYLLCDGSSVSRTTYADLFAVIGTTYGSVDGSHFTLPDATGRVIAGKEASATRLTSTYFGGDSTALGATGGAESHTLTQAELPAFKPAITITDPGHSHAIVGSSGAGGGIAAVNGAAGTFSQDNLTGSHTTGITAALTSNLGSGNAHAIVQPTLVLNYIIFAGV